LIQNDIIITVYQAFPPFTSWI